MNTTTSFDDNNFCMIDIFENGYYEDNQCKTVSSSTTNNIHYTDTNTEKYYMDVKSVYSSNSSNNASNTTRKHLQHIETLEEYNKFVLDFNNTFIKKISIFKNDEFLVEIINDQFQYQNVMICSNYNCFNLNFYIDDKPINKNIFFDIIILLLIFFNKKKGFNMNKTYKINRKYIAYLKYWNIISVHFPTNMLNNRFIEIRFNVNIKKNIKEIDIAVTTSFTNNN